jgi:cell wall-associated NlpC family hydrolase
MVSAVITHNVVALRAEPRSFAEQISQAILGESVSLLSTETEYSQITTEDGYQGWALSHHLRPYRRLNEENEPVWGGNLAEGIWYRVVAPFAPFRLRPYHGSGFTTQLVFGSFVLARSAQETPASFVRVEIPSSLDTQHHYQSGYLEASVLDQCEAYTEFRGDVLAELAQRFIGTPYLWGGGTSFGFDCSGYVQRLYKHFGILLPRDAYQQVHSPLLTPLSSKEPFQAGDLLFFKGDHDPQQRGITHVGMALDPENFIHASGKEGVGITPLSDPYYARTFQTARRFR